MKVLRRKDGEDDFFEKIPRQLSKIKRSIIEPVMGDQEKDVAGNTTAPFRSEIYTREKMQQLAAALARRHAITYEKNSDQLLRRLAQNEQMLLQSYSMVTRTIKESKRIAPAAEWLLDNFYLVEEQIYTAKKHFPKGYSKTLPRLTKGDSAGLPRIYDMAVEIISHSDGHVDVYGLTDFVNAYQAVTKLNLGELWAIPIMLRLALLENLRRLSMIISEEISNKALANKWADQMIETAEENPRDLVLAIADMSRSDPPMKSTFVAELVRRLQEKGSSLSLPLNWIEQRLAESGSTSSELIQKDNQEQAATQVSISNSISSLRFITNTNWRDFVENTSIIEAILKEDIAGVYAQMDFNTRDGYRHAVEKMARCSGKSEEEVALFVVDQATKSFEDNEPERCCHVGYYLTGKGYIQTSRAIGYRADLREKLRRFSTKNPALIYLGSIAIISVLISWALISMAANELTDIWEIILMVVVILLATSHLAVAIVNWVSTILARPLLLPRMNFSSGVPEEASTMVVIPTMITSLTGIDALIEGLEIRFLANRGKHIYFGLLTDFKDASSKNLAEDDLLVTSVKNKITALNSKYANGEPGPFYLFHRLRKFNAHDKTWMGYERKRGKLEELNGLLRGKGAENFSEIVGHSDVFSNIKYVITLDTDTQLPRESAWKMIGSMAHILNKPEYNEKKKRVTEGYSILQPRVSNSLPAADSSAYAQLYSKETGTDPYTRAISDVYQDLFAEGSYIGKGIYDVDAFEKTLKCRFPENRILSHDLLEGCYARSGLITDIQLYEEYPMHYRTDMQRRQRWIRGDWQVGRWILPWVPGEDRKLRKNPLSLISKWKIFDNIRRSLVPTSLLGLLLYGWVFSSVAWFWTLAVTLIIVLPSVVSFFWELFRKPKDVVFSQQLVYTSRTAFNNFVLQMLNFIFLPYEVFMNLSAILRTLWRMFVSHKKLLEWNPYSVGSQADLSMLQSYREMWFEPFFSIAVYSYLSFFAPATLLIAFPFLGFWMLAPGIAYIISRSSIVSNKVLSKDKVQEVRMLGRKIWAFFEKFVTAEDNWLPPDNYQEEPVERIAHRTSPTNIGLSLLSNLTAYDFGYITLFQLLERTNNTVNTIQQMKMFRGHLFNWYDTNSLSPLFPRYVSTVDSGNFAGHLVTLKQGLAALPEKKILGKEVFNGIADTVNVLIEYSSQKEVLIKLREQIYETSHEHIDTLRQIKVYIEAIEIVLEDLPAPSDAESDEAIWWQKLHQQLQSQKELITSMAPWLLFEEVPDKFTSLLPQLPAVPTLKQIALIEQVLLQKIISFYKDENTDEENDWLNSFRTAITNAGRRAKEQILTIERLSAICMQLADIDYSFLFDKDQHLLTIGYNVEEHRKDSGFYDLLASEARLGTYLGIAMGKIPQDSWFSLGRQLTNMGNAPILLSWSGSMFEYLMPLLVMPTYDNTLLHQSNKAVVQKQIEYGKQRGIPWGISESGYNMLDANLNYQYKAFGVPGTGFKRGLGEDLVIAPYATAMALMVLPNEAYDNMQVLKAEGFEGRYGFYEAIDYTPSRLRRKQEHHIIKSFMAHHQGMSFLSIAYLLLNKPMQQLFENEVHLKSALLLLQEKVPRVATFYSPSVHAGDTSVVSGSDASIRVLKTPHTDVPEVQLLSNGRYHVMVTNAGGGYSRWKNLAVTRWREDSTLDNWGSFCYIRDLESSIYWSASYQPSLQEGENYEAVFSQSRAEFRRRDFSLETHTEIVVSPEDDIELRRVHITNRSRHKRSLEITSYAEVVLATQAADESHPAFSNLFVQTEINEQRQAIICTRRPRSMEEKTPWMFHLMKVHDAEVTGISYETDRYKFIGRGNQVHNPQAMKGSEPLQGHSGSVLDPIVSIQYRIELLGNESVTVDIITGMAETREGCIGLVDKYQERHIFNRVLELAWTHSQVILRQINAAEADAQLYAKLASSIVYSNAYLRTDPATIIKNHRGQSDLWSYSISGDIPIVLVQIEDSSNISLVKQMVQAHLYWRLKGLVVDLVIWNDDHGGYRQDLQNEIQGLIAPGPGYDLKDQPGGIYIRSAEQISNEDRILFQSVAHMVISDKFGSLEEQMNRRAKVKTSIPYFTPTKFYPSVYTTVEPRKDMLFDNGIGGFTQDGKEYIISTSSQQRTPAPWINVLANPGFGSIITENGQSYTWVENAHEIRLSPWNNDPVTDLKGEAFYLKDEESGKFWSPAPLPCRGSSPYITRHGFGYSIFEHSDDGIFSEMTVFTDIEQPVKFVLLKVRNNSGRKRKLSATGYVEWVLGELRSKYVKHTITGQDEATGALLAWNVYSSDFAKRVAFFGASGTNKTFTTDRTEFLGRNGQMSIPDGLNRARLSGKTGAALDPCAALQVAFELGEEEEHELVFYLGAGTDRKHALQLLQTLQAKNMVNDALLKVHEYWNRTLGRVQIYTPDTATNILANGWLNYQAIASRIWGRSGFYQSGGAFGFRDQLQDVLSLMHTSPEMVRAQILLAASRQFREGDVQHWWHPPAGRGVRTTCSDDYLWLPYVCSRYVHATGDEQILNEQIHFLEGRSLNKGEESYYDLPIRSDAADTLYVHCKKAIENGLRFGRHGLPLIGSGDWNDGMDKVGEEGKGESIWLAFFLYEILVAFTDVARIKDDGAFAKKCLEDAEKLKINIRENGWDGDWYRRAYFDDGTPLGSTENEECKIDSIAQSWSVLSGGGDKQRSIQALQSADEHLVRKEIGIIQLFNPPFDKSTLNPGYIQGYVPGVRENGGQYTHAAIWLVMAFAKVGNCKRTWELLQMINPLNRGNTAEKLAVYKTEPYVVAADVYAEPLHKGQGGWTWYTGSAGWMYQLIVDSFIGLQKKGNQLGFNPCVPAEWERFNIDYTYGNSSYHINFVQTLTDELKPLKVTVQGEVQENNLVTLVDDGGDIDVTVEFFTKK